MESLKFQIKNSPIHGKGAFATEFIKLGSIICNMEGEEIPIPELIKRFESGQERRTDPLQVSESTYIDLNEPFVLINHSCKPNAAIVAKNSLVAISDIKPGFEITYDYSLTECCDHPSWGSYEEWNMACACGYEKCRGVITEFQNLPPEIQQMAIQNGYVQDFIKRRHETLLKKVIRAKILS